MRRFLLPATLFLGAAACGNSPSNPASVGSTASALLGDAALDTVDTFSVGVCGDGTTINQDPDAGPIGICALGPLDHCTGTLVAPNLVLTARHCFGDPIYAMNSTGFCDATFPTPTVAKITLSSSTIEGSPVWLDVSEQFFPADPPAGSTTNFCDNDVALLVLAANVPASQATPIAIDVDTDIAMHPPSAITVVGRGGIADVLDLDASSPTYGSEIVDRGGDERRILQNIPFVCASDGTTSDSGALVGCTEIDYSSPPTNVFTGPPSWMVIGFGPASGDSGSAFIDQASFTAGQPKIVATNSAGTFNSAGVPDHSWGVRMTSQKAFLVSTAQHAATVGGYPLPVWAGGTSTPDAGPSPEGGNDAGGNGGDASTMGDSSVGTGNDSGTTGGGGGGNSSGCAFARFTSRSGGVEFAVGLGLLLVTLGRGRRRRRED